MLHLMLLALLVAAPVAAAPIEYRLSPDAAEAAIASGAETSRAADALALARTDPKLALLGERDRSAHGEVGVGIGSNGARELFGAVETSLGDHATAAFAYDYSQFGRRVRNR